MLVLYSKNSINLDNIVNPMPIDVSSEENAFEEEFVEETVVQEQPEVEKTNIMEIMNRLANLKIDIDKQSSINKAKIDKKLFVKVLRLVSPEPKVINSKYSYTTIKKHLLELKELTKKDSLSLGQCLSILNAFDAYEKENKNTINPAVKSMLVSIEEVKVVIISKLYPLLMNKANHFKERMDQLIKLYQNKMVFDDLTLEATLYEMNANIDIISTLYKKYFNNDLELKKLYDGILERKDTILELVYGESKKGM